MPVGESGAQPLTLGVMGRSRKENEGRLALHPAHLRQIPDDLRARIFLERGYGERFGLGDADLEDLVAGLRTAEDLVADCDVILQPKPVLDDLAQLRVGQTFWGWPHCVQDTELTQMAIDKRLTLIAFEAMNHWNRDGSFNLHVFHSNNELAGYCSVLHAMRLAGITGNYGPRLSAVVIGFGATARGAVYGLTALGVADVDVLTHRQVSAVASPIHSARLVHFDSGESVTAGRQAITDQGPVTAARFLARHDLIVNCVLQDPDAPEVYLTEEDLPEMKPGTIVVDVSCDEGMGFSWARSTSFEDPTFVVGDRVLYYAVDHSPSYLWGSATWVNSEALLPFLPAVMGGPQAWDANPTVQRAIEIREGAVQNPAILSFQRRSPQHPHYPLAT